MSHPKRSLDITLYKASTSTFCCLLACEQILAALLPLALTPPTSFTPSTFSPPHLLCFCVHDLTWLNKTPGLEQGCPERYPKRGGEDWLCGGDLERCPRLGSNCPTCQIWWILAKNKSKKGPSTGGWMNSVVLLPLTELLHRAAVSRSLMPERLGWCARSQERSVSQTKHPLFCVWQGGDSATGQSKCKMSQVSGNSCTSPPFLTPPHAHSPATFIAAKNWSKTAAGFRGGS